MLCGTHKLRLPFCFTVSRGYPRVIGLCLYEPIYAVRIQKKPMLADTDTQERYSPRPAEMYDPAWISMKGGYSIYTFTPNCLSENRAFPRSRLMNSALGVLRRRKMRFNPGLIILDTH